MGYRQSIEISKSLLKLILNYLIEINLFLYFCVNQVPMLSYIFFMCLRNLKMSEQDFNGGSGRQG